MGAIAEPRLGVSPLFSVSFHPLSGCAEEDESLLFLVSVIWGREAFCRLRKATWWQTGALLSNQIKRVQLFSVTVLPGEVQARILLCTEPSAAPAASCPARCGTAFVPWCCVAPGQGYFLVFSQRATPLWVTGLNFLYASYCL